MTALQQKEPRVEYPAYLAWVRKQPCTVSRRPPPSDAAHLRAASLAYSKPLTGMQQKPHDWWVLPLNHEIHMAQHERGDELAWWAEQGIPDPFALAVELYASRPAMPPPPAPKPLSARTAKPRKPPAERKKIQPGRKLPVGRKLVTSNDFKRQTT